MKYNKLIEVLFSTKNFNKILTEFNKLSLSDKQIVLTNDKIKKRLYKIMDINLLINLLIDLPYETRINFLKGISEENYYEDYEKLVIEFLKLQDYDEFDYTKLTLFENMKDKQILLLIFRKISADKLKHIVCLKYNQFISDFAFISYSKKNINLILESELVNCVSENILYSEIKKRSSNNKVITEVDINEFFNIDSNKQNYILINGSFENLENNLIQIYKDKIKGESNETLANRFDELTQNLTYINLLELQTIICSVDNEKTIVVRFL